MALNSYQYTSDTHEQPTMKIINNYNDIVDITTPPKAEAAGSNPAGCAIFFFSLVHGAALDGGLASGAALFPFQAAADQAVDDEQDQDDRPGGHDPVFPLGQFAQDGFDRVAEEVAQAAYRYRPDQG